MFFGTKIFVQATSLVCAMGNHKHILKINFGYLLNHLKLSESVCIHVLGVYLKKIVYTKQFMPNSGKFNISKSHNL